MPVNIHPDDLTKAKIVYMILNRKTEEALQNLSKFYNITPPEIVVGLYSYITIAGYKEITMYMMKINAFLYLNQVTTKYIKTMFPIVKLELMCFIMLQRTQFIIILLPVLKQV
jgi:hypothetical protein